jgi:catechol 2,3-dioxygenase-like lactoylglutathione lyase family enzyme
MFCSIESVTVGVSNLESSLKFFRDRLGMSVVNDTRASVGLVAAWRRPVHESVRLVDLASAGALVSPAAGGKRAKEVPASAKTLPPGRIRLAVYEDLAPAALRSGGGTAVDPARVPSTGPWALEFFGAGPGGALDRGAKTGAAQASSPNDSSGMKASNRAPSDVEQSPDGLCVFTSPTAPATNDLSLTQLALRVASTNLTASTRFYTEALGLQSVVVDESASSGKRTIFGSPASPQLKIIVADPSAARTTTPTAMSVGQLGFNLITLRCEDLDELRKRIEALGMKAITEPTHVGLPFGYPSRVMIVAGPNGELFELDEITE